MEVGIGGKDKKGVSGMDVREIEHTGGLGDGLKS